jgi:hypothetical protein
MTLTAKSSTLLLVLLGLTASSSRAQAIADLNTGVDSSGTPLAAGLFDPHSSVAASPGGATTATTGSLAGTWLGADTLSQWIYATPESQTAGQFDFSTNFWLPSDFQTASITGQFATDNEMVDVYLNGTPLGISQSDAYGFEFWTAFSIPMGSDFLAGENTLDFVINNDGGPEGLRVEMTGDSTSGNSVPDSGSTIGLVSAAFVGLGALRRRLTK